MTGELVARSLTEVMEYSKAVAAASIIPRAFQGKPADVLVAVEYGNALGIRPVVALSEINVINGTPSLSASLMASLARQAGHKVRVTSEPTSATCTIVRADDPEFEHVVTWDEARARSNGLWGKGHWAKDPQVMLEWRAISACVRKACPEVLAGLRYTPEEVQEFSGRTKTPPPVEDAWTTHNLEAEPATDCPPSGEQLRRLFSVLREAGLTGRDESLAACSGAIGRDVESSSDLTRDDVAQIIGHYESPVGDPASEAVEGVVLDPDDPAAAEYALPDHA